MGAKTRTRAKPKDPQVAAAERRKLAFEAVGLQGDAAKLRTMADVEAKRADRTNQDQARRMDAFAALFERADPGEKPPETRQRKANLIAARRLERDITIARGEHDRGRSLDRVDNDGPTDRMDAMLKARWRVDIALGSIGQRDAWLLTELIAPSVQTALMATTWRGVVAYITGEENPHAQGAAVRSACANLAMSYERKLEAA